MDSNSTQLAGLVPLFLLMLVVGLELTPADFKRVLATPRAIVVGTLAQILLLPAMTWAVVSALGLSPAFAAGAVLVAIAPGAGISNIFAALARVNVALSVTLTAIASVLAVVTLPIIASLALGELLGDATTVEVPVGGLMLQLAFSLLLPLSLGMALRTRYPERADKLAPTLQRVMIGAIVLVVVVSVAFSDEEQLEYDIEPVAFIAAGVWTLAAMLIGWTIATLLRLSTPDRFTFLIEFSARNIAISSIVALSGLGRIDLTFFSGVYGAVGFPLVAAVVLWRRRMQSPERAPKPG